MSAKIRNLQARKADLVKSARDLTDKVAAENRDFSPEEQAEFDGFKAQIDSTNNAIDREQMLAAEEAGLGTSVEIPAAATIRVSENIDKDPKRGFQSFGDFAKSVANAANGASLDRRLIGAVAPGTPSGEMSGTEGGFAIPPEFSSELWRLSLNTGDSLLPLTQNTEIQGNSMMFPKDETTPWGGSGIQTYWQGEAKQAAESKVQLGSDALVLHKLMTLVPVTNELIGDGFAIDSYLSAAVPERIQWKVDEAILFGDGIGKPLGALNGPSLVVQAKDSGQAANTITNLNISNMVSRLLVGQLKNAVWIGNPDILPALESMTLGNYPIFLPNNNASESSYGMLKGRPVYLSEHANALSAQGDLNLVSLSGYRTITKAGGIQTATSMHLYFDADATAFRFTFRMNGKPILSAPVTPPKSTNKRSHFVALGARA